MKDDEGTRQRRSKLSRALKAQSYSGLANILFGDYVDQYADAFADLRTHLVKANINVLFRTYVSIMFLSSILTFIATFAATGVALYNLQLPLLLSVVLIFAVPFIIATIVLVALYYYPSQRARQREASIENNLPFALNQMAAVASSGIPPSSMFKLLTNFQEYREVSTEAEKIVKKVDIFGEDLTTALREVAAETPSDDFKEVLYGLLSTIETGGSLEDFLNKKAEASLFEYKIRRKKDIENLSTYASFYTAILVAAPLFLVAILAVMNIIGGELFGYDIQFVMQVGVYAVIPTINTIFITMLHITQTRI